ncbi:MAG: hypothetical protein HOV80_01365, partial [Polyangiaceae bacterium]|nr:hypothetical protein [Polyangiaceae bacterium]
MRLLGLIVLAAAAIAACGDDGETDGSGASPPTTSSSGGGDPASFVLHLEPLETSVDVVLGEPLPMIPFKAFARADGTTEDVDVTLETQFSLLKSAVGTFSGATLTLTGVGGTTAVVGSYHEVEASAALSIRLIGDVIMP